MARCGAQTLPLTFQRHHAHVLWVGGSIETHVLSCLYSLQEAIPSAADLSPEELATVKLFQVGLMSCTPLSSCWL